MKPSLQEQLQYLTRIVNPNYIIIARNKASEDMDFSHFRVHEPEIKEKKVIEKRYKIIVVDWEEGQKKVLVKDTYFNNRVVYDGTCRADKIDLQLEKVNKLYRADTFEKI